ncbi:unnamed protein product [Ceutorhynchus assimilis]|uniref:Uncharacterized protein n=1 Tax=Ceutorhynchus assimilis TaxID=467358 RepID=A0A9N9QKQ8_9CUCU|nr:unnamed protein product [Ceutorhynchus assimilis]
MDNRRTTILKTPFGSQQPKLTGSDSKFVKPRSVRKKDAANTTLSSNFKCLPVSRSTPSLNQSVRPNLDTTVCGFPGIKPSMTAGPPLVDKEFEHDLAYNDYMVALMKQQLTKKVIENHKTNLNSQLIIQCEQLLKLENIFKDIAYETEALIEQRKSLEMLDTFKFCMDEKDAVCSKYNTYERLNKLIVILNQESNLVRTAKIKPINSQEEYEKFIETLKSLKSVTEKILSGDRKFQEVNELTMYVKKFNEINSTASSMVDELYDSNKKAICLFLKQFSDNFAKQGGYF